MKTVGDILKEARIKKSIELDAVSRELKIHRRFLDALESSDYRIFSGVVHIKGFLRNYSKFLGLDENEVLAFFRREYESKEENKRAFVKPISGQKLILTPGVIVFLTTLVAIVTFLGYLFVQYNSFAGAPLLAVESPSADMSTNKYSLDVFGRVDKDAELLLNGQRISQTNEGTFAVTVSLSGGVNVLNFDAVNKLGKMSKVSRTILVQNTGEAAVLGEIASHQEATGSAKIDEGKNQLVVELEIVNTASWVSVSKDGELIFPGGVMLKGVKATFKAAEYITIRAGNAGAVKVYLNGKDLGVLGKDSEVVEKTYKNV